MSTFTRTVRSVKYKRTRRMIKCYVRVAQPFVLGRTSKRAVCSGRRPSAPRYRDEGFSLVLQRKYVDHPSIAASLHQLGSVQQEKGYREGAEV